MSNEKKIGVYICTGCGIDSINVQNLVDIVKNDYSIQICKTDPFLCENTEIIKKDIKDNLDAVVIAACSPRAKTDEFSFEIPVERVNLREQVLWSHLPGEETQSLAEDYLRMGISKAKKLEKEIPEINKIIKRILVVGGGITGITSAVEAAEAGYEVVVVEKNPFLGGRVARMNKYFPKLCPPACGLEINFKRIRNNNKIKVYTNAEVEKISGAPGDFDVIIRKNPDYILNRCTACGECVKACPYERLDEFNYGMNKTKAIYLPVSSFPLK
jgi:heterodisulfide reductase subunit A-like polyferredoxin